jgi:hypothetical protein
MEALVKACPRPLVVAALALAAALGPALAAGATTAVGAKAAPGAECRTRPGAPPTSTVAVRARARRGVGITQESRVLDPLSGGVWACVTSTTFVVGPPARLELHLMTSTTAGDRRTIGAFLRRSGLFSSVSVVG